ncbi:cellobiose phosphorylase [Clostridium sp. D53t1_180928_C8]|uniref:GH36-type glycosyl hydrolase domain-containing protein n=1 Tax=Clostridium sp. D53t1_180928_C8 TaxID=2787101 RepID=UPI0018AB0529|nr:cellobiose phosphorylase [Clostridium sp. D53t1_180928_C8]
MEKYKFIDNKGTFELKNSDNNSYMYFPLANDAGMMSAITQNLHGDIKLDQNTFILPPVSSEDLHNTNSSRNFWINIEGKNSWSATGNSAVQKATKFNEEAEKSSMVGGLLWHEIRRENEELGVKAIVTSFVPVTEDTVELNRVTIKNIGKEKLEFTPTVAVPLYCRSAGDIRDHRHVTSLLNRTTIKEKGVWVKPTMCFDERGHTINTTSYGVFGTNENGEKPNRFYPSWEEFIGEGGSFDWPEAVVKNIDLGYKVEDTIDGYETIGAFSFNKIILESGEERTYYFVIAADKNGSEMKELVNKYLAKNTFEEELENNKVYWSEKLKTMEFKFGDDKFNNWMKWVTLQPILRRIYGCSFLPHHDYGRGGRGWRDLWQDCLALLLMEPVQVRELLWNNFGGVRVDGSNATIIGSEPGEFIADRNSIARVWMDHGAWPFLTTKLYLDRSGDLAFLLKEQTYFKDKLTARGSRGDENWTELYGNKQRNVDGEVYTGTILEHLLIQHITAYFNVGAHNIIKLEGADWNDAFDMASINGESVAFTALYANNLEELSKLLLALKNKLNVENISLMKELNILLADVDFHDIELKNNILSNYFEICEHNISGERLLLDVVELAEKLSKMANEMKENINKNEWIESKDGHGWFNGYYDDKAEKVEGDFESGVRMTLTGQVFSIMGKVASEERVESIVKAVDEYLFDLKVGGCRLNSDFKEVKLDLGRCFGFAFGHKENGAMFSHMAVMYANALYKRGFKAEGHKVLDTIYKHCVDFDKSKIYPGIPEYINERGRGLYNYLTGSASWLLLTMVEEVFGIKGDLGDLVIMPKLDASQLDSEGKCSVTSLFADKLITFIYEGDVINGEIKSILTGENELRFDRENIGVRIKRKEILDKVKDKDIVRIISN